MNYSFHLTSTQEEVYKQYQTQFPECTIGRVTVEFKQMYSVATHHGDVFAEISGKMRHSAVDRKDYPAVGDYVVIQEPQSSSDKSMIYGILPRTSKFSRKTAGLKTEEQIVAANVDTVFLVNSLTNDVNLRRLERYLLLTWESGSNPVIVLTKSDMVNIESLNFRELERVALGIPYHLVSAATGAGLDQLEPYVGFGKTMALLGSSGAGKSTLVNALMGETVARIQGVREDDDKGRHTTTHREMHLLPTGGVLIDTPGMRELQLWTSEEGLSTTFEDVLAYAERCKFTDCLHQSEPGCAVQAAIATGDLPVARLDSYQKLQRELLFIARKDDQRLNQAERQKWKNLSMTARKHRHRP